MTQLNSRSTMTVSAWIRTRWKTFCCAWAGQKSLRGPSGALAYAKAILFFAHQSYKIRTHALRVRGSGGEYLLSTEHAVITGTQITVELDDDSGLVDRWRDRIEGYVSACYMEYATGRPVTIRLDEGEDLPQNNDSAYDYYLQTYRSGHSGTTRFLTIAVVSSTVFVGGLPMFTETFYSRTNQSALVGGIELESGSAVLTANRDGFITETGDVFAKVVGDLIQDQSRVRYGQALDLTLNIHSTVRRAYGNQRITLVIQAMRRVRYSGCCVRRPPGERGLPHWHHSATCQQISH